MDRGSLGPALCGRQRSAFLRCCSCCCSCWAVSSAPGARVGDEGSPGGEGAWATEASVGPPWEYQPTCGAAQTCRWAPKSISGLAQAGCFPLKKSWDACPDRAERSWEVQDWQGEGGALSLGEGGTQLVPAAPFPALGQSHEAVGIIPLYVPK